MKNHEFEKHLMCEHNTIYSIYIYKMYRKTVIKKLPKLLGLSVIILSRSDISNISSWDFTWSSMTPSNLGYSVIKSNKTNNDNHIHVHSWTLSKLKILKFEITWKSVYFRNGKRYSITDETCMITCLISSQI